jgi:NADPH:quinone reductase-like Zn-dependent oxidoreductase
MSAAVELPAVMKAAYYEAYGLPTSVVHVGEISLPPSPQPNEVLVKVHASSLNPADWKSASGEQKALLRFQWPRVYGFDFSGVVVAVGEDVKDGERAHAVGDEVFGMIAGIPQRDRGTLAEYVLVDADVCAPRPMSASHAQCAAMPLVAITAVKMLRACPPQSDAGGVGPRVLITGGAGGVGTVAIQLARALCNASYVVTTASKGTKAELCLSLGADRVIDYRTEVFEKVLASDDEAELFDIVLDCTGDAARCVPLLRRGGGMCSILAGQTIEALRTWMEESRVDPCTMTFGVRGFLNSGLGAWLFPQFTGGAKLARACARRGATFAHVIGTGNGGIMVEIAGLMAAGKLRAVIDSEFVLDDAVAAIEKQRGGHAAGKVVVNVVAP